MGRGAWSHPRRCVRPTLSPSLRPSSQPGPGHPPLLPCPSQSSRRQPGLCAFLVGAAPPPEVGRAACMDGWGLLASPLKKGESVPFPQEGGKEGTQVSGQEPAWKKPGKQEYARGSRDVFPSAPPPPVPSPHSPSQTRCPGGRGQPTANVNKAPAPGWKPARRELARVPAAAALRRCASAPEIDLSKASFIRASAGRGEPGGAPRTRPWPLPLLGMTWGPHKPPLRAAAGRSLRAEALRKP